MLSAPQRRHSGESQHPPPNPFTMPGLDPGILFSSRRKTTFRTSQGEVNEGNGVIAPPPPSFRRKPESRFAGNPPNPQ